MLMGQSSESARTRPLTRVGSTLFVNRIDHTAKYFRSIACERAIDDVVREGRPPNSAVNCRTPVAEVAASTLDSNNEQVVKPNRLFALTS